MSQATPSLPSTVTLQPVTLAELPLLTAFISRYYAYDEIPFLPDVVEPTVRTLLTDPAVGRAWFITLDQRPIGYAVITFGFSIEYGGRYAFLDEFFIEEESRGKGIGRRVLSQIESAASANGVLSLQLEVEKENHRAQKFYDECGYADFGRRLVTKGLV